MGKLLENKAQEEAIRTLDGPVLVVSCPGSGKTTTLVRRIRHMIETGISASNILMVTFSKEAANGMAAKYISLYGSNPGVTFATLHSLCFNILRSEGIVSVENVLKESEKVQFFVRFLKNLHYYKEAWEMATTAATAVSSIKNNYLNPGDIKVPGFPDEVFTGLFEGYTEWCRSRNKIDFDDMLIKCKELLEGRPDILSKYQERFRYVQCDEYQDTNYIQRDILYLLADRYKNICVVGDDDQSIYAFRGAKPEIMLNFSKDFPDAKIIHMGINYRSADKIVGSSDLLIRSNDVRFAKDFISQRGADGVDGKIYVLKERNKKEEMKQVISQITRAHENGVPYQEMAILFRTNQQAQHPVLALSDAGIPYYSTEYVKSIYESFIFDDIKAYVSLACGTGDRDTMLSVLNHPTRYFREASFCGIPYTEQAMLQAAMKTLKAEDGWKLDAARKNIHAWIENFGEGKLTMQSSPLEIFKRMTGRGSIHYDKYLVECAENRNFGLEDLVQIWDELQESAAQCSTIEEWFVSAKEYTTRIRNEIKKKDHEGVMVTTMHRSKGLEWQYVFIIDADEDVTPHKKSVNDKPLLDEERRLFYVAMTRAKDVLFILSTHTLSRFVLEAGLTKKKATQTSERKKTKREGVQGEIPKYLAGHPLSHSKFGKGSVVRYEPGRIIAKFGNEEKAFKFPDAFHDGFLNYG